MVVMVVVVVLLLLLLLLLWSACSLSVRYGDRGMRPAHLDGSIATSVLMRGLLVILKTVL